VPHVAAATKGISMARRFPLLGKSVALGAVLLVLVIALQAVSGIVEERQGRLQEAEASVAASLAAAQTLLGPVLTRACTESWDTAQGEGKERKTVVAHRDFTLSQVPATLDIVDADFVFVLFRIFDFHRQGGGFRRVS